MYLVANHALNCHAVNVIHSHFFIRPSENMQLLPSKLLIGLFMRCNVACNLCNVILIKMFKKIDSNIYLAPRIWNHRIVGLCPSHIRERV